MNWNWFTFDKKEKCFIWLKMRWASFFIAWQLVNQSLLFGFYLLQTLQLDGVSIKFSLFLIQIIVKLHHFLLSVLCLWIALVSFAERSEFFLFDFDCKFIHAFVEGVHNLIERNDFGDELHGETLELIRFTILFSFKNSDVVILVEGNGRCGHEKRWGSDGKI